MLRNTGACSIFELSRPNELLYEIDGPSFAAQALDRIRRQESPQASRHVVRAAWLELTNLLHGLKDLASYTPYGEDAGRAGIRQNLAADPKIAVPLLLQAIAGQADAILSRADVCDVLDGAEGEVLLRNRQRLQWAQDAQIAIGGCDRNFNFWRDSVVAGVAPGTGRAMLALGMLPHIFAAVQAYASKDIFFGTDDVLREQLSAVGIDSADSLIVRQVMMGALHPRIFERHGETSLMI